MARRATLELLPRRAWPAKKSLETSPNPGELARTRHTFVPLCSLAARSASRDDLRHEKSIRVFSTSCPAIPTSSLWVFLAIETESILQRHKYTQALLEFPNTDPFPRQGSFRIQIP
jgi:hypothetical protein